MVRATAFQPTWNGTLRDLSAIITTIRQAGAFGRLTLRSAARLGVVHLYFHHGSLVHAVSTRGDTRPTLDDLRLWATATVRFERGVAAGDPAFTGSNENEQLLDDVIAHLQVRGVVERPRERFLSGTRVIESHLVSTPESNAEPLIAPFEWKLLVEGMRRISLAVAHLVGPREAMSVLRDILDDCIAGFPSLAGLQIAPGGFIHVTDGSQLERVPRFELLEGFAALFTTCQHFCAPIIGDDDAHALMLQALSNLTPHLMSLGVLPTASHLSPHGKTGRDPYSG